MSVTPDGRHCTGGVNEGIIGRNRAVVVDPVNLAVMIIKRLRKLEVLTPVTDTEKQVALPVKSHLAAKMVAPVVVGHGLEEDLLVGQGVAPEPRPHDGRVADPLGRGGVQG